MDLGVAVGRRSLKRLPSLLGTALRLTWHAGRGPFLVSAALQVVAGLAVLAQLLLGRELLQRLVEPTGNGETFQDTLPLLAAFAGVTAAIAFANLARLEMQRVLGELVGRHTTGQVLNAATAARLIDFENARFHDRLLRAMVNASARPVQMTTGLLTVMSAVITILGVAGALVIIQPLLLAAVMFAYVPVWLATARASKVSYEFSVAETERDRRRQYLSFLMIDREAAPEIRAFNLTDYLRGRYERLYDQRIEQLWKTLARRLRLGFAGGVVSAALTAGTIGGLVWMIATGRLDLAAGGAAAGALLILGQRLQALASGAGGIFESALFLEDFTSFVAPDGGPRVGRVVPAPLTFDRITVEGLSFTYPSRTEPSIDGVDLQIQAGEIVALVGENGSGKTTLAKMLAGLYTPSHGTIRWDGLDLREMNPERVHASVGLILQDYVKYFLTIRENIGLGAPERLDDDLAIVEAAKRAGAHEFISALPKTYDTPLGTQFAGSTEFSGGQWQRIALARAFFRDAPLLILDEPTAALDPRSEAALFERIRELYRGRTVLLVSHRFSTVRSADRILVMEGGKIVEAGDHNELMQRGGLYAEMFTLQAAAYKG